jgi:predicted CopG family antitoxin
MLQEDQKLIRVDPDVHAALEAMGKKGDSFNTIIKRLIEKSTEIL